MAMIRLMAREAIGVAPLPPIVVRDELEAGMLREILPLPSIAESFFALTVERQFPNSVVNELISGSRWLKW
jgi:LysR family transcriptional activator of nhaA